MNRGVWCTKEDVLKDLEVASGRRVADVSDSFFVIGEQPPPPPMFTDEDDEIELQFGKVDRTHTLTQNEHTGPDLNGITKMLRMVQDYETSSDEEARMPEKVTSKRKIIISKLNPNVKEFIPKSKETSQSVTISKHNAISSTETSTDNTNGSYVEKDKSEINDKLENDKKSDVIERNRELTKESRKELAEILRSQIPTKKDTFEEKRRASLAIVNLLKLYAKPETNSSQLAKPRKHLELLTPEFFQKSKAADFKSNVEDTANSNSSIRQEVPLLSVNKVKNTDEPQHLNVSEKSKGHGAISKHRLIIRENNDAIMFDKKNIDSNVLGKDNEIMNEATSLTPDMADASIDEKSALEKAVEAEIAESITKVNNWLDDKPVVTKSEKEKPKTAMYLGPVVYKRKDPATCKSPSEVTGKKISKPDNSYKPSSYADELLKRYKERNENMDQAACKSPSNTTRNDKMDLAVCKSPNMTDKAMPKPTVNSYQPSSYADELLAQYKNNSKNSSKPKLNIWEKLEEDLKKKDEEIRNRKKKGQASAVP